MSESDAPEFLRIGLRVYKDEDPDAYHLLLARDGLRRSLYLKHLLRRGVQAELGLLNLTVTHASPNVEAPIAPIAGDRLERLVGEPELAGEYDPSAF